jgi:hypothetical protein
MANIGMAVLSIDKVFDTGLGKTSGSQNDIKGFLLKGLIDRYDLHLLLLGEFEFIKLQISKVILLKKRTKFYGDRGSWVETCQRR